MLLKSKDEITGYFEENRELCKRTRELFSIFANETRFKILCVLREGDFCVREIVEIIESGHSNVSQQLKLLRLGGYVTSERHGKMIVYHLANDIVDRTIDFFQNVLFQDSTSQGGTG